MFEKGKRPEGAVRVAIDGVTVLPRGVDIAEVAFRGAYTVKGGRCEGGAGIDMFPWNGRGDVAPPLFAEADVLKLLLSLKCLRSKVLAL